MSKSSYLRIQRRLVKRGVERELQKRLGGTVPTHVLKEMAIERVRERVAAENEILRRKINGPSGR